MLNQTRTAWLKIIWKLMYFLFTWVMKMQNQSRRVLNQLWNLWILNKIKCLTLKFEIAPAEHSSSKIQWWEKKINYFHYRTLDHLVLIQIGVEANIQFWCSQLISLSLWTRTTIKRFNEFFSSLGFWSNLFSKINVTELVILLWRDGCMP